MAMTYEEVEAQLTAPGAPFEVSIEPVRGIPMKSFKHRERSLREKIANVALHGEADCMVQGERRISYGEFARLVWGAARALREDFGLQHGDRLAVLAYNSPEWLIALFGATSLGGIGVGIKGWWKSEEIHYGMSDSGSRYLVVDERLYPRSRRSGRICRISRRSSSSGTTPRPAPCRSRRCSTRATRSRTSRSTRTTPSSSSTRWS
jgi:long-subunit acyl-CoA synthetase (AMP-forming)